MDAAPAPSQDTPALTSSHPVMDVPVSAEIAELTSRVAAAGLPAISIPCGQDKKGLPIGIQFIGKPFDELTILQVANFVEETLKNGH